MGTNVAERIWQVFVGAILILVGLLILFALYFLVPHLRSSWLDTLGIALAVEAYSVVALLFILLGLRYVLGQRGLIERAIGHGVRHVVLVIIVLSAAITGVSVFVLFR